MVAEGAATRLGTVHPVLVGRTAELHAAIDLAASLDEGAHALVLSGAAGLGKSAVWEEALERFHGQDGVRVLACRPSELGQGLAYCALAELLEAVPEAVDALDRALRDVLRRALRLTSRSGTAVDPAEVALATAEAIRYAGPRVVLAIDDAHWLDPASTRVLRFVTRRLQAAPLGVLATTRASRVPAMLGALPPDRVRVLELAPLSEPQLTELIRARLGAALSRPTLSGVLAQSGGNPLYALELARTALTWTGGRAPPPGLLLPDGLRQLLGNRVHAAGAGTREVLLVVAAAAAPTVDLVRSALGPASAAAIQRALDSGVLQLDGHRLRFAHPLLAAAAYDSAEPARRRRVHARLAELAADDEDRARHLAAATDLPDAVAALTVEAGAEAGLARGAPEGAALLAERAAELTPASDVAGWARRTTLAADCAWQAGDDARCLKHLTAVSERLGPGPQRAQVLRRLATRAALIQSWRACLSLLDQAISEAGNDPRVLQPLVRDRAFALMQSADVRAARVPARAAIDLAGASGDLRAVADAEASYLLYQVISATVDGPPDGLRERLVRLSRGETTDRWLLVGSRRVLLGAALKWTDCVEDARSLLCEAFRTCWDRQQDGLLAPVLFQLGELEVWAGRYGEAEQLVAVAAEAIERSPGRGTARAMHRCVAALVAARRGDLGAAADLGAEAVATAHAVDDGRMHVRGLAVLGFVALSAERYADALAFLDQCDDLQRQFGYVHPGVLRSAGDHVEALIACGEIGRARVRLEELDTVAHRVGSAWGRAVARRCRGLLDLALDDKESAVRTLGQAATLAAGQPDPFEHARALVALGAALRRNRQRLQARAVLQEAGGMLADLGASGWQAKAVAEIARAGAPTPAAARDPALPEPAGGRACALTPMQATIAELVASGCSNKQIAAQLYISPKTVEAHLSAIYRQLGLRSRTELAALLLAGAADVGVSPMPGAAGRA